MLVAEIMCRGIAPHMLRDDILYVAHRASRTMYCATSRCTSHAMRRALQATLQVRLLLDARADAGPGRRQNLSARTARMLFFKSDLFAAVASKNGWTPPLSSMPTCGGHVWAWHEYAPATGWPCPGPPLRCTAQPAARRPYPGLPVHSAGKEGRIFEIVDVVFW